MVGLVYGSVVTVLAQIKAEQEAFVLKCSLLPQDEADKLIAERKQEMKERKEHREKLEIANAGRARNFWGN